jgi:serine protease Do
MNLDSYDRRVGPACATGAGPPGLPVVGRRPLRVLVPPYVLLAIAAASFGADGPSGISPEELAAVKAAEAARVKAIESVYGAVVAIYGNERQGGGSGVLFDPAGYALTNHHVIAAAGEGGWAGLADGKLYRWKLIGTDPGGDVAIIKLAGQDRFPTAPLGDSDAVRVGDWALAMGNPFALAEDQRPTVTLGLVSGIKRFQEGAGLNQLVYGNCIQVDSSINPGNSGGPLFDIRGRIIGINGRGSFEERGRVNVGLGYAISSNQIKRFIPELLATKIAQHGTIDAMFGNRTEGVICYTLNLDSPAAKAGLALGDKLIAFERTPIHDANEFTNLLSTYPAGWPAELTFEREGQQKTIHARLSALPYERFRPANPQPPKPPEDKPAEEEPKPNDPPPARPQRPEFPLHDAGKIRDLKVNRAIAEQLVSRWRAGIGGNFDSTGMEIKSEIHRGDAIVGWQTLTIATGGRVRAEYEIDGKRAVVACDGSACWDHLPDRGPRRIERGKAILDPHFAQAVALAAALDSAPFAGWGELALDGSDKANDRLCYRLSLSDPATSEQLFVWLSVFDAEGKPSLELVKTGVGLDDDEQIASTIYSTTQPMEGVAIPQRRTLVLGLAEAPGLSIATNLIGSEIRTDVFRRPD